ncbi:hypothetical protein HIM_01851 [Hirsutella minnesotensis 3608]|nr:hypothetical protein HIM_01851 [Hirsutella minnesotensis 3608]
MQPKTGVASVPNVEASGVTQAAGESAASEPTPYDDVDIGMVIDVKGELSTFRDEMQVRLAKMCPVKGTEQELKIWEKRVRFRRDVLDKPWILSDGEVRKCRKRAEGSETKLVRKRTRPETTNKDVPTKREAAISSETRSRQRLREKAARNLRSLNAADVSGKYRALGL